MGERLKSTLKKVKIEMKNSWNSMVVEDLVLSKIEFLEGKLAQNYQIKPKLDEICNEIQLLDQKVEFLEEKLAQKYQIKPKFDEISNEIQLLDQKVEILWKSQSSTFNILIIFSLLFSFVLF